MRALASPFTLHSLTCATCRTANDITTLCALGARCFFTLTLNDIGSRKCIGAGDLMRMRRNKTTT